MPKYTQDILCELFHHINKETIISVLVSCDGNLEKTTQKLMQLQLSIEEQRKEQGLEPLDDLASEFDVDQFMTQQQIQDEEIVSKHTIIRKQVETQSMMELEEQENQNPNNSIFKKFLIKLKKLFKKEQNIKKISEMNFRFNDHECFKQNNDDAFPSIELGQKKMKEIK